MGPMGLILPDLLLVRSDEKKGTDGRGGGEEAVAAIFHWLGLLGSLPIKQNP